MTSFYTLFLNWVFNIWVCFILSAPEFGLATFRVLSSHRWLVAVLLGQHSSRGYKIRSIPTFMLQTSVAETVWNILNGHLHYIAGIRANPSSRNIIHSVESCPLSTCCALSPKTQPCTTGEKIPSLKVLTSQSWSGVEWCRGLGIQTESIKTDT